MVVLLTVKRGSKIPRIICGDQQDLGIIQGQDRYIGVMADMQSDGVFLNKAAPLYGMRLACEFQLQPAF